MTSSFLILTDSGGIQEEAPSFNIPVLILREETERPEGLLAGTSILVGSDKNRIYNEVKRLLMTKIITNPLVMPKIHMEMAKHLKK